MKTVVLTRGFSNHTATLGTIQIEGERPLFTLENPWLDNRPSLSCIPKGLYLCAPFTGEKYKAVYEVKNVVNRSYILFHAGNTVKDTRGCILLGMSATFTTEPFVSNSREAVTYFKNIIGENEFWLEVCAIN